MLTGWRLIIYEVCRDAHFLETFVVKKRSNDFNLKSYVFINYNLLMKLLDSRFHANSLVKNQKIKQISHLFGADADWARRNAYSMSESYALPIHLNMKTKVVITSFLYFVYFFHAFIIKNLISSFDISFSEYHKRAETTSFFLGQHSQFRGETSLS